MLSRSGFVMLGLREDSELPEFVVQLLHEGLDARFERAEIVIVKLLSLRGLRAEERPPGKDEIGTLFIECLVDKEILLLGSDRRNDL